jgi:hypothetical protein
VGGGGALQWKCNCDQYAFFTLYGLKNWLNHMECLRCCIFDMLLIIHRWGSPYLTREFFHDMGSKMGD